MPFNNTKWLWELHQSRTEIVSLVLPIPQQEWKCDGSEVKANTLHLLPLHSKRTNLLSFLIDANTIATNLQCLTMVMKRQRKGRKKRWKVVCIDPTYYRPNLDYKFANILISGCKRSYHFFPDLFHVQFAYIFVLGIFLAPCN